MYDELNFEIKQLQKRFELEYDVLSVLNEISYDIMGEVSPLEVVHKLIRALHEVDISVSSYDEGWNDAMKEVRDTGDIYFR